jgi:NAD(P)-dependent dehydrogenase (short-subunit alcohol dehydrogenase family)|tara:strand:- start:9044 stop:9787 length:744 start_codon:yes stop_codon:yes gene_type:complete
MRRVALITGASSGIGLALTNLLLETSDEISVVAVCRDRSNLVDLLLRFSERLNIVEADIATENGRNDLCDLITSVKKIEFLVHCAAIVTPLGPLENTNYIEWKTCQQTNVDAPVFLTLKLLNQLSHSRVLFLTSDTTLQAVYGAASYCVSKMALHMAYACLKTEISPEKAVFGLVAPGNVDTPMQKRIRMTDPEDLPIAMVMKKAYEENQFLSPQIVASYISRLLLCLPSDEFESKCWNIYEDIKQA